MSQTPLRSEDFIPQLEQINIPGLALRVNYLDSAVEQQEQAKQLTPVEGAKKEAKVRESIDKLNTALKSILTPQPNATKVELNVGRKEEEGKTSISMLTDGLRGQRASAEEESFLSSIAGRLTSLFKDKDGSGDPLVVEKTGSPSPKRAGQTEQPKESALTRFFYFVSRRSSPPEAEGDQFVISQNVSQPLAIESKSLPNSSSGKMGASLVTLVFSVVTSALLLFNIN